MNWYSLRVMSGKEEKIKSSIFRELEYEPDIAKILMMYLFQQRML